MKKRVMTVIAACVVAMSGWAQYAEPVQLPTFDLYDSGVMNAYARAMAETAARREGIFQQYVDLAFDAWENERWAQAVRCINGALDTGYWNADLYYMRGYAYERLGDLKAAKKDYREGKKKGSEYAAEALGELLKREKESKKK